MLLLLRKADEVLTTYKELARMYLENENLKYNVESRTNTITALDAKIVGLETENEILQREVDHWKAEAQARKPPPLVK